MTSLSLPLLCYLAGDAVRKRYTRPDRLHIYIHTNADYMKSL
jgi:hypothetical protein